MMIFRHTIGIYLLIIHAYLKIQKVCTQCNGTTKTIEVGYRASFLKFPESGEYSTNLLCEWLLSSNVSGRILYKSTNIDIDCSDSLSIYDGSSASSQTEDTSICTTGSPISKPIDRSSGQELFLKFVSDGTAKQGKDIGFTIYFISASELSNCTVKGSVTPIIAGNTIQAFTSPLFPETYPLNHQCTWIISPSTPSSKLTLALTFIDIDYYNSKCYDKLTISYDQGPPRNETVTEEVCGDENFSPTNTYTYSGSGDIIVTFTSDDQQPESGFVAVYSEIESRTTESATTELTTKYFTTRDTTTESATPESQDTNSTALEYTQTESSKTEYKTTESMGTEGSTTEYAKSNYVVNFVAFVTVPVFILIAVFIAIIIVLKRRSRTDKRTLGNPNVQKDSKYVANTSSSGHNSAINIFYLKKCESGSVKPQSFKMQPRNELILQKNNSFDNKLEPINNRQMLHGLYERHWEESDEFHRV